MREFEDFPRLSTAKVIGRNAIVFVAAVLVGALADILIKLADSHSTAEVIGV